MNRNKFQCDDCGYYWKIGNSEKIPQECPVCYGNKVHRAAKHKRFAKKSRPKVRRLVTTLGGRT